MSHSSEMADRIERPMHDERMHHPKSAKLFETRLLEKGARRETGRRDVFTEGQKEILPRERGRFLEKPLSWLA